jgi:hypothetical protein
MIHPHTEVRFISETIGYGVVATKFIPKGTITWALDKLDRSFDPDSISLMEPLYQDILEKYCYRNNVGEFILCWDIARFVNHSFNSNCISTPYEFEIAVRDIHPGEELTDDYGYLNVTSPFDCLPEMGSNRKSVMPDDLLNFYPEWDEKLQQAFPLLNKVAQPLRQILPKNIQEKVDAISKGKEPLESILLCYFDDKKQLQPSYVNK